jgi:hypothetical protein
MRKAGFGAAFAGLLMLPACGFCNVGDQRAGAAPAAYVDVVRLPANADGIAWIRASDTSTPGETVQEFVPAGQTAAEWRQII